MNLTNDDLVMKYREQAIRDLVPGISAAKPFCPNRDLSQSLYSYMIDILTVGLESECDRGSLVEDVVASFDHDLAERLDMKGYQIDCRIQENATDSGDPMFGLTVSYKRKPLADCKLSTSIATLMKIKRVAATT